MVCRECRRQIRRRRPACDHCGTARQGPDASARYALVLPDGSRVPIAGELTIGRGPGNLLRVADPAVSRRHARVVARAGEVEVVDLESASGTFLDGHSIQGRVSARDGQRLRIGDTYFGIERQRDALEADRTIVVPVGATAQVASERRASLGGLDAPRRPRLRSGWALKRLAASEGPDRFVLADLRGELFLRFGEEEARLLKRLDGHRTTAELVLEVEKHEGSAGVRRLVELLAELAEHGLLADAPAPSAGTGAGSRLRRLLTPREWLIARAPGIVERLYRAVGFASFTTPALILIAAISAVGAPCFVTVIAAGGVRPLHVAGHLSVGALVFVAGRFAVVTIHELAHALTLASFGRRPRRIGVKLVLVFPCCFVDTSEAWFEPRRRRVAVTLAGPVTDACLGGAFSAVALLTDGTMRSVAFQLAIGAYLGLLLNLNPLLDRDGYHALADVLKEPSLRRRAREDLQRRLAGAPGAAEPRVVRWYGIAAVAWPAIAAVPCATMAFRSTSRVLGDGSPVAIAVVVAIVALGLVPLALALVSPLRARRRRD